MTALATQLNTSTTTVWRYFFIFYAYSTGTLSNLFLVTIT